MSLDANSVEDLKSIEKCRNIHKEIINFGVHNNEILKIIELLSLELEDTDKMRKIIAIIKEDKSLQKEEKLII
jgi:hypothetical protein